MKFKNEYNYTLRNDEFLNKIFTSLPDNSFIDKGRCGNGGTHIELYNLNRSSIIIVPNVTITKDKSFNNGERVHRFFSVHGDVKKEQVSEFLNKKGKAQKIITTPAGLAKIIWAAKKLDMLNQLYESWFCLMDESHSVITETYRDDLIKVFNNFWNFKSKCLISATPYDFSDSKIYDLDYHKIEIAGEIGQINLVSSISVKATLKEMINQSINNDSKYFIFYNSVREIVSLIKAVDSLDIKIYCANDREGKNMLKLGDLQSFWREQPKNEEFGKINFFTTTSFEGWDMNIPNSVMIVATDYYIPHTLVPIDKCVQALGRARKGGNTYWHVFNHRNILCYKSLEDFRDYYIEKSTKLYKAYLEDLDESRKKGFRPIPDARIEKFCDNINSNPVINSFKLDRFINEEYKKEVYNHKDYIGNRWIKFSYKPIHMVSFLKWESKRDVCRKSKAKNLEIEYCEIIDYLGNNEIYFLGNSPVNILEKKNPLAYRASKYLDKSEMEILKYNPIKVELEIIKRENDKLKIQLMKIVNIYFKTGNRYSKKQISAKLKEIYKEIGILNKNGKPYIVTATDIEDFFDIKDCKIKMNDGKYENGFQLVRQKFHLRMAS